MDNNYSEYWLTISTYFTNNIHLLRMLLFQEMPLDQESVAKGYGICKCFWCSNSAYFGQADSSTPILLDDVRCTGQEASITDCVRSDWYAHNCRHYEDAGVSCTSMLCHCMLLQKPSPEFYN